VFQGVLQFQLGLFGPKSDEGPEYVHVASKKIAAVAFLTMMDSLNGGRTDWLDRFVKLVEMHTSSPM
jgi:hypothetical protein